MTPAAATPPVNVYESQGRLTVAIPVPGAHGEHTSVVIRPDRLHVVAECKYPQESQHFLRQDWQVGSWQVELELPRRVDPKQARASLNFGVLVVMAPESESGEGEERLRVE